jgi:hypothetical protein
MVYRETTSTSNFPVVKQKLVQAVLTTTNIHIPLTSPSSSRNAEQEKMTMAVCCNHQLACPEN